MEYLRKIKKSENGGYTLVEIMVALSIMVIIFFLSGDFIINIFRSIQYGSEFDDAVINARRSLDTLSKEIRGANNSDRGEYPIELADSFDLIFFSDIDYDGDFDRVRYLIEDRTLYKIVTQPGPTLDYSGAGATTTIAHYLNNEGQDAFVYYDGSVAETSDKDNIRMIRIHMLFNVKPGTAPDDILVETDVHLRNLKSNL